MAQEHEDAEQQQRQAHVRGVAGIELSDSDVETLAAWYAATARSIAAFPAEDLKRVEPPLRSVAGPLL